MARYIDADKLREYWLENGVNECVYNTNDVLNSIDYQTTADVEEVKRGEWIEEFAKSTIDRLTGEDSTIVYRCSRCGRYESQKEPYCNCGAKMDGGKK